MFDVRIISVHVYMQTIDIINNRLDNEGLDSQILCSRITRLLAWKEKDLVTGRNNIKKSCACASFFPPTMIRLSKHPKLKPLEIPYFLTNHTGRFRRKVEKTRGVKFVSTGSHVQK